MQPFAAATDARRTAGMRRDARERRDALLRAAAECFGAAGYMVPLETIAERAGVGRGTLYRNFKDRMALVLAVFDQKIDELEAGFDPSAPFEQAFVGLVERGAPISALFNRLAADMPLDQAYRAEFQRIGARVARFIRPAVEAAQRSGLLSSDLDPTQVLLAFRMVIGLLAMQKEGEERAQLIAEAVPIIMNGLRAR